MEKPIKARKKKKLGSYPYLSVVFSITLALFVFGLFASLIIHSQRLATLIRENVEIQVYLRKNVSENQQISIRQTLASMDFVATNEGQPRLKFISKEEAAKDFVENTGEDFDFLGENPLRDAFVINLKEEYQTEFKMDSIRAEISNISGVFEVEYIDNLITSINQNITKIGLVLVGFTFILVVVVIILIGNTIKLALFSQRFLIRSMQLVGATKNFILKPFLLRSAFHGFLGGVFASLAIMAVLNYAYKAISELAALRNQNLILILFGSLIISGILLGFFSTLRAARKYMNRSLDELY